MASSIIFKYFPDLTPAQKIQFEQLGSLYKEWNEKINVISRKDIDELYERHVLHSLAIAKFTSFSSGSRILDVGTGGGFPGIPLAILFPEVAYLLVDSTAKKIQVVKEITSALKLENVQAEHARIEELTGVFDFVLGRAVSQTKQLCHWTKSCISKEENNKLANGWIFLKGGDLKNELSEVKFKSKVKPISNYFNEPYFETKKVVYLWP